MYELPVDQRILVQLSEHIHSELSKSARMGAQHPGITLEYLFEDIYGLERSREERLRFMLYAAPIARIVAFEVAPGDGQIGGHSVSALREWFSLIDTFDPEMGKVLDLYAFAKLSAKDTAAALQIPARTVICNLKLARVWWQRFIAHPRTCNGVSSSTSESKSAT